MIQGTDPLAAARAQSVPRVPFLVEGEHVGSVASAHVPRLAAWRQWIAADASGGEPPAQVQVQVQLHAPRATRDAALATMNAALREEGLIRAWRDEPFSLFDPADGRVLATFERASTRFWGTLTLGAHANGFVADATGRPTHLWIARRAWNKATDPGCLDNLIGGGVPHGQTPLETVVREGWEEAGLAPAQMQRLTTGRVIELDRDVPEGRQFERLHVYDLELDAGVVPANQDGEVAQIMRIEVEQAAQVALSGQMTVDAALVTLDFLLRHHALPETQRRALASRLEALLAPARP
jgi:8-oxo-dGTP pyrophosphatase MutT (NUDIX family)